MARLGGDPERVNPVVPTDLVVDHSVIVDVAGRSDALRRNVEIEYGRNTERYEFLRWGQESFDNFRVVPPGAGIVHQVNIEHLARVVCLQDGLAYPDTCLGTDSHTTMVNGLGVLGWGAGGIEAEAAMLGQPVSMLIPQVVGIRVTGDVPAGTTATDVVLSLTEQLRRHGVVGEFVEFYGDSLGSVPMASRVTIGNMSPEFGSTCAVFPIDGETLAYLRATGRSEQHIVLVEAYAKQQGLWHDPSTPPRFSEHLELDLSAIVPSIAGPTRPQDRIELSRSKAAFRSVLPRYLAEAPPPADAHPGSGHPPSPAPRPERRMPVPLTDGTVVELDDGHVVIAAITSCTNTSNPDVMVAAGLLARNAVRAGLTVRPWVKTSMAPGSTVVTAYLERAGLLPYLEKLGYHLVGYGCTTCNGNSGPLPPAISAAVQEHGQVVAAVLSGNRNFEGRINPDVQLSYLASPPLVVAYALAGTVDWDRRWRSLPVPEGDTFAWSPDSTCIRRPPYLEATDRVPGPVGDISGARVLVLLGDSITTDHISPGGAIRGDSPAGRRLTEHGVPRGDFNSYGSRRGNHEVMVRGTFANSRLRNRLVDGIAGGHTRDFTLDEGPRATVHDAARHYAAAGIPLLVLAGRDYGSGSSRDWAAKGTRLLGVRAVIAESFERIHRSNLIGMGVLPLEFPPGESAGTLGLDGTETFAIAGIAALDDAATPSTVRVTATHGDRRDVAFDARVRLDTATEAAYYRHGGILPFVLRSLLAT